MPPSFHPCGFGSTLDYTSLSCSDILSTIYTALSSRVIPFNTTVTQYRRAFESLSVCTCTPDTEARGIECILLLDKIDKLLAEQKALLESLDAVTLAKVLVQSVEGKAMGFDEQMAKHFVEDQLSEFWEGYWDAESSSCVDQRRGDVECEVEFVLRKLKGRTQVVTANGARKEDERNAKLDNKGIVWTRGRDRLQAGEAAIGEDRVRVGIDV